VHPRAIDSVVTRVIADVAARGVTARELERVKNGERASSIDGLASVLGKASQLSYYNYFAGTPDFLAQDLARFEALTPADVQRVAAQYLAGKPRAVLTVVPEGKTDLALTAGGSR
jgi:zinc protease